MKYRAKPVIINAVKLLEENRNELFELVRQASDKCSIDLGYNSTGDIIDCVIKTLEGYVRAKRGDYIVLGTQNELYPCKPDIFEEKYERVLDKNDKTCNDKM